MEEVSVAIGDITVVAERRKGSDVSIITAIKSNSVVSSGISNQQIQRSQDRDASEVVKRVPGVTIQRDQMFYRSPRIEPTLQQRVAQQFCGTKFRSRQPRFFVRCHSQFNDRKHDNLQSTGT